MKKSFIIIIICFIVQNIFAQNIPHANFTAPWGIQVNTFSGNLYLQRTDLVIPNQGLFIDFSFAYNSFRDTLDMGYGKGWTSSYSLHYENIGTDTILVVMADGRRDIYIKEGGQYHAPEGIFDRWEEYSTGKFRLTTKYGMQYFFDQADHKQITKIEDTNGNQISFNYSGEELVTVTDNSNRSVSLIWNAGQLASITDTNFSPSRNVQFSYTDGLLTKVTDLMGNEIVYGYNDFNSLHYILNEKGDEMQIQFNEQEKVSSITTCLSHISFSYNPDQGKTYVTENNENGDRNTTYTYDDDGKLIQKTGNCCGYNTQYQYDIDNNINTITDANGSQFTASHDAMGNPLVTTDAEGGTQSFSFESNFNRIQNMTDKRGNTTSFEYDINGNLDKITQPEGIEVAFDYDETGNITNLTDGNGHITSMIYNENNDVTTIQYPIGNETFIYDAVGNIEKSTNGNGNSIEYEHNSLNLLTSVTDDLGNTIRYEYDPSSNLTEETDANNNQKIYSYDALHRLESVTTPSGSTIYAYDASDNLVSITDANFHSQFFEYDQRDLLVSEKDPLNNQTSYSYDGNGNMLNRTDANGMATSYTYDRLNRLLSKNYDGNTDNYSYDVNGNLIQCSNNHISMSFTYDELNRLLSKTINNWNITIEYEYNYVGNRTRMIDPSGVTDYDYDANNRLIKITNPSGEESSFFYDNGGRLIRQEYDNGTFTIYEYDVANRLLKLENKSSNNALLSSYIYTYDGNGNRLSMTTLEGIANYLYDGDNRLTTVNYTGISAPNQSFEMDGIGNRTSLNDINYSYDAADRLQNAGNTTYDFDANGNLILKSENNEQTRYYYNGENQLVRVKLPNGNEVSYQYDPFGNRIGQIGEDSNIRYLLDGENVLMELDASGNTLARYTSGLALDSWISMEREGASYFYHTDGLGSITSLTNTSQNTAAEYQYDAYGNILSQTGTINNPYTYTGREFDNAIGLYYYRTRFYDAEVGRFISRDRFKGLLQYPSSFNTYNYVKNSPINFKDQSGQWIWPVALLTVKILGTAYDFFSEDGYIDQIKQNHKKHGLNVLCYEFGLFDIISFGFSKITGKINSWKKADLEESITYIQKGRKNAQKKFFTSTETTLDHNLSNKIVKLYNQEGVLNNKIIGIYKQDIFTEFTSRGIGKLNNLTNFFNTKVSLKQEGCSNSSGEQEKEKGEVPPPPTLPEPDPPFDDSRTICIPIIRASDPNEIIAPDGCDIQNWIAQSATLPYTILYENDPDFATAPAQKVIVEHVFDDEVNPFSFRLGDFGFGDYYFEVPEDVSFYTTQIDLSDSLGILLDVTAGLDVVNNKAFWVLESKDPVTGLTTNLPADAGYLPVNDSLTHKGEGFVNFTIRPKFNAQTWDTIHAQASIIFDDNSPILTNLSFNLIDANIPASQIQTIDTLSNNQFHITWTGIDIGSGIVNYILYVATNQGLFLPLNDQLIDTEYTFQGEAGNNYQFTVIAIDCAGNIEPISADGCALVLSDSTLIHPSQGEANGSISLSVLGYAGELTYNWTPLVSTDSIAINLSEGTYSVELVDELGCSLLLDILLEDITVRVEDKLPNHGLFIHRLYPVPARSILNIAFYSPSKTVWLEVYNTKGQKMLGRTLNAQTTTINTESLNIQSWAVGTYIVHLRTKRGKINAVFVKQ